MKITQETYTFSYRKEDQTVFKKVFATGLTQGITAVLEKVVLGKYDSEHLKCSEMRTFNVQKLSYECKGQCVLEEGASPVDTVLTASYILSADGMTAIVDKEPFYDNALEASEHYGRNKKDSSETVDIVQEKYDTIVDYIKEQNVAKGTVLEIVEIDADSIKETIVNVPLYTMDFAYGGQSYTASVLATGEGFSYKEIDNKDSQPTAKVKKPLTIFDKVYNI